MTTTTLNGYDETTAKKMIDHFWKYHEDDKTPIPTSVWFSKPHIALIATLLQLEGADGIRVYIGADPNITTPHLKTSILLVSTKSGGPNPRSISINDRNLHADYYDHLVTFSQIGDVSTDVENTSSRNLYQICTTCTDDPSCVLRPNNITVKEAETMVHNFGKNFINTKAGWFDLSIFQTIANLPPRCNGIRIYLATHPLIDPAELNAYYSLRDTFVITTTEEDPADKNKPRDYYDCADSIEVINFYAKKYKAMPPIDFSELCPDNCNN